MTVPTKSLRWMRRIVTRKIALAAAAAGLLVLAAWLLPARAWLQQFVTWVSGMGALGMAIFVLVYVLAAVLFLPGVILTLGAGAIYGPIRGVAVVSVASTLGAAAAFLVARYLARDRVSRWAAAHPRFAAIDAAVGKEGGWIVLLTRLSPVFPYNLLNYLFGLTRVGFWPYFLASWIGMLPATFLYVYLGFAGSQVVQTAGSPAGGQRAKLVLWGAGLVATAVLTYFLTRIARKALTEKTS